MYQIICIAEAGKPHRSAFRKFLSRPLLQLSFDNDSTLYTFSPSKHQRGRTHPLQGLGPPRRGTMTSNVFTCVDARQEVPKTKPSDEGSDTPSSSSSATPEPSAPMEATNSSILDQTVKGLKEVATVSYASVKEWASSPRFSQQQRSDGVSQPESPHHQAARKALSDLMSPFMACQVGMSDMYESHKSPSSKQRSFQKSDHFPDLQDNFFNLHMGGDSETIFSMDTAIEDEMMQMRRLASWSTNATNETLDTEAYGEQGAITDDDGRLIPTALLETANKRREKRMRTRVVRFDYPPISSLRECPRHNPDDLPDLFFTEEELDEIEADRSSAVYADDIEIVAVASVKSSDSYLMGDSPAQSGSCDWINDKAGGENSSPSLPQKLPRKPRSSSPHPNRPAKGSWSGGSSNSGGIGITTSSSREDPRLIRGVQIYLRERSTGKSVHRK